MAYLTNNFTNRAEYLVNQAKKIFDANPLACGRKRNNVHSRIAITHILFDEKYSHQEIATYLNKDYATISYYKKSSNDLLRFDKKYKEQFQLFFEKTCNTSEKSNYLKQEILLRIKEVNSQLFESGCSSEEIEVFWKDCIEEVEFKNTNT